MSVLVGRKAPQFSAKAVVNGGEFVENFSLDQYLGKKYVVLFFFQKILRLYAQPNCMHFKRVWQVF